MPEFPLFETAPGELSAFDLLLVDSRSDSGALRSILGQYGPKRCLSADSQELSFNDMGVVRTTSLASLGDVLDEEDPRRDTWIRGLYRYFEKTEGSRIWRLHYLRGSVGGREKIVERARALVGERNLRHEKGGMAALNPLPGMDSDTGTVVPSAAAPGNRGFVAIISFACLALCGCVFVFLFGKKKTSSALAAIIPFMVLGSARPALLPWLIAPAGFSLMAEIRREAYPFQAETARERFLAAFFPGTLAVSFLLAGISALACILFSGFPGMLSALASALILPVSVKVAGGISRKKGEGSPGHQAFIPLRITREGRSRKTGKDIPSRQGMVFSGVIPALQLIAFAALITTGFFPSGSSRTTGSVAAKIPGSDPSSLALDDKKDSGRAAGRSPLPSFRDYQDHLRFQANFMLEAFGQAGSGDDAKMMTYRRGRDGLPRETGFSPSGPPLRLPTPEYGIERLLEDDENRKRRASAGHSGAASYREDPLQIRLFSLPCVCLFALLACVAAWSERRQKAAGRTPSS